MTPDQGAERKAWTKRWALMRKEFLDGKVLDALVVTLPDEESFYWSCPVCGATGKTVSSGALAQVSGRGHMQSHVNASDEAALEKLKLTHMPDNLLTPFQRERKRKLGLEAPRATQDQLPLE